MVTPSKAQIELEKVVREEHEKVLTEKDENEEIQDFLKAEEKARRDRKRPSIDHLDDAIVRMPDGTPVFVPDVGEKVIIERFTSLFPSRPWLDTKVYTVRDVDPESGRLSLWDDEARHWVLSNFIDGLRNGYRFKIVPSHGTGISRRRHKRTKEEKETAKLEAQAKRVKGTSRRGRPKGSKNRDKSVIQAEKMARAKVRAEKAAKREMKNRTRSSVLTVGRGSAGRR